VYNLIKDNNLLEPILSLHPWSNNFISPPNFKGNLITQIEEIKGMNHIILKNLIIFVLDKDLLKKYKATLEVK